RRQAMANPAHARTAESTFSAETHTRPVEVSKTVAASAPEVFRAWSDPEVIKQWWGPNGFSCPFATVDFKVDGKYLYEMFADDGNEDIWSTGTFEEIEPDKRIVMTCYRSNSEGDILGSTGKDS